jgi:hypothetical protein
VSPAVPVLHRANSIAIGLPVRTEVIDKLQDFARRLRSAPLGCGEVNGLFQVEELSAEGGDLGREIVEWRHDGGMAIGA